MTGDLSLKVYRKSVELNVIGSEHTLYLLERDSSDELNFKETVITVLFEDPCLVTKLLPPRNLSETTFSLNEEGLLWI